MAVYDKGDLVRLKGTFKNSAGALTDPTTVTFKMQEPDGATTTKTYAASEVVRESLGVFYFDWSITKVGAHIWRMEGTGAVQQAQEGRFVVGTTPF